MSEDTINWSLADMVTIKQPDDFLKVRETLTRIGVRLVVKTKHYFKVVTFYINKVSIT